MLTMRHSLQTYMFVLKSYIVIPEEIFCTYGTAIICTSTFLLSWPHSLDLAKKALLSGEVHDLKNLCKKKRWKREGMNPLRLIAGFILMIPAIVFLLIVVFVCIACSTHSMQRYRREIDSEIARRRIIVTGSNAAAAASAANARGLDETRIKSCSELRVVEMNGNGGVVSCSICLEEYGAKEIVRQINSCQHRFHADCVDHWFLKHTTCPICRISLLDEKL